jgi:hypothetical protein
LSATVLQRHPAYFAHIEAQGNLVAIKGSFSALGKVGGGRRGLVNTFTPASRRRMLRKVARIAPQRVVFITLTYPKRYPDPRRAKDHLRAFFERIRRRFPTASGIWRLELQERGAPHFHLLMCELPFIPFAELRRWWTEIIREFVDGHLPRVRIEQIRSRQGAFYYVSKYCAKLAGEGEALLSLSSTHICTPGRWWGVFNRNHLPYAERLYAIVEIMTPVGFRDCKALLNTFSPEEYPNLYRGKVIFAPDSLKLFRVLIDLLKPDMRKTFYNRYSRWTHENQEIRPVQNLLHPSGMEARQRSLKIRART